MIIGCYVHCDGYGWSMFMWCSYDAECADGADDSGHSVGIIIQLYQLLHDHHMVTPTISMLSMCSIVHPPMIRLLLVLVFMELSADGADDSGHSVGIIILVIILFTSSCSCSLRVSSP